MADEKFYFTVVFEADQKKFKVGLKTADFLRLKIGKIKRQLERVTGVPSHEQQLQLADGAVIPDHVTGAASGIVRDGLVALRRVTAAVDGVGGSALSLEPAAVSPENAPPEQLEVGNSAGSKGPAVSLAAPSGGASTGPLVFPGSGGQRPAAHTHDSVNLSFSELEASAVSKEASRLVAPPARPPPPRPSRPPPLQQLPSSVGIESGHSVSNAHSPRLLVGNAAGAMSASGATSSPPHPRYSAAGSSDESEDAFSWRHPLASSRSAQPQEQQEQLRGSTRSSTGRDFGESGDVGSGGRTAEISPARAQEWLDERTRILEQHNRQMAAVVQENARLRMVAGRNGLSETQEAAEFVRDERSILKRQLYELESERTSLEGEIARLRRALADNPLLMPTTGPHSVTRHEEDAAARRNYLIDRHEAEAGRIWESSLASALNDVRQRTATLGGTGPPSSSSPSSLHLSSSPGRLVSGTRPMTETEVSHVLQRLQDLWNLDRQRLLENWCSEADILSSLWGEDREMWARDRHLLEEERSERVRHLEQRLEELERELIERQVELEKVRSEAVAVAIENEQTMVLARSAHVALQDIRERVVEAAGGDRSLADMLVSAASEKAREQERALRLERQNSRLVLQLTEESTQRRKLHNIVEDLKGNIRVVVRMRPFLSLSGGGSGGGGPNPSDGSLAAGIAPRPSSWVDDGSVSVESDFRVKVTTVGTGTKAFDFYKVLGPSSSQDQVWAEVAPLMQSAVDGYPVCIFAYGQTGAGKTYTLYGKGTPAPSGSGADGDSSSVYYAVSSSPHRGIIPRACEETFRLLSLSATATAAGAGGSGGNFSRGVVVCLSMVELYLDQFRDLLAPAPSGLPFSSSSSGATVSAASASGSYLQPPWDSGGPSTPFPSLSSPSGVSLKGGLLSGVSRHFVRSSSELLRLLAAGTSRREVHSTASNSESSRSHMIVFLDGDVDVLAVGAGSIGGSAAATSQKMRLCFVDLAGSERISKSRSTGDRFKEAQHINKSLSALGDVVSALSENASFVPYRNSKLTSVLAEMLGGHSKTLMFANICPEPEQISETSSTLGFAARVKMVRNQPQKWFNNHPLK